jgi:hypothetical protein
MFSYPVLRPCRLTLALLPPAFRCHLRADTCAPVLSPGSFASCRWLGLGVGYVLLLAGRRMGLAFEV